jgi:hypothetical protein
MTGRTRGRPSLYREEYADDVYKFCLLGATDQELGDFFGVHRDTIHEWKRTRPDFSDAITRGKMLADAEVAAKLYERACGYVVNTVKLYRQDDGSVLQVPYQIEHPPDSRRPAYGSATGSPIAGATSIRSTWPTPAKACWPA